MSSEHVNVNDILWNSIAFQLPQRREIVVTTHTEQIEQDNVTFFNILKRNPVVQKSIQMSIIKSGHEHALKMFSSTILKAHRQ